MLVSLKWLQQYVNIQGLDPKDLAEKITRSGIEVDAVIDRSSRNDKCCRWSCCIKRKTSGSR